MSTFRRFLRRLAAPFRSARAEHDLAREIRAHLQLLEDRFLAQGMNPDEARYAAQRAFGGVEQAKEYQRDARSFRWMDNSRSDFKLGARMLAKYPGLSLIGGAALGEPRDDWSRTELDTERWHEIVGVVSDLHVNEFNPDLIDPLVLHPLPAATTLPVTTLIRVRGRDATDLSPRLREMVISMDPSVRLNVFPFVEMERQQQLALRLSLLARSLITLAVLLLSAAGIYALMSFTVSRQRKEIGIRAAMGADMGQLLRGIFTRAAAQLAGGVALGAALALLADLLSGGEVLGPAGRRFVPLMAIMMIAVGLVASIGPARRSLRVQPIEALRDQ